MCQPHPHDAGEMKDLFVGTGVVRMLVISKVGRGAAVSGEGVVPVILENVPGIDNSIIATRDQDPSTSIVLDVLDPVCVRS